MYFFTIRVEDEGKENEDPSMPDDTDEEVCLLRCDSLHKHCHSLERQQSGSPHKQNESPRHRQRSTSSSDSQPYCHITVKCTREVKLLLKYSIFTVCIKYT